MTFKPRFTKIQGLSDRRRLPRLGSIRLGIKVKNTRGVEYPKETEYFVCPEEVQKIYGAQPYELDVMLPINEIDAVFPTAYKHYGSSRGLKCSGDGETAFGVNQETREMVERKCPCEKLESGKCKQSATLMVMLPRVSVGGVYQIRTSSYNSIVDINSGVDYVSALLGRFALVPLKLRREKIETHHEGKKQNHYTLKIIFDADINTLNALRSDTQRILEHPRYQLPAPLDENPELDPVDIVLDEEDSLDDWPLKPKAPEKDRPQLGGNPGYTARNSEDFKTPESSNSDDQKKDVGSTTPEDDELLEAKSELSELKKANMPMVEKAAENLKMSVSPMTLDGCMALAEEARALINSEKM